MLLTRLISASVLIPIAITCIVWGGPAYLALLVILLTVAEIEFCILVSRDGYRPATALGLATLWLLLLNTHFHNVDLLQPGLSAIILIALTWYTLRQRDRPVANWGLTLVGGLYLGLLGSQLLALRAHEPDGLGWSLIAVLSIAIADAFAYLVGHQWGRNKLAPSLSPNKTWEGYIAGVVSGALGGALIGWLWQDAAQTTTVIDGVHGLALGLLVSTLAPLGDLAISMIKRQVGAKDSGKMIPGHGGALDRTDSVLWAAAIAYYYVLWLVA